MRALILTVLFLALPAMAMAQQASETAEIVTPKVQMEQTTPQSAPASVDITEVEASEDIPVQAQSQTVADEAAMQPAPPTTSWWWLVGAIVVAGLILALVL